MDKKAMQITWGDRPGSYLHTVNPFSGLFNGVSRVPEWWMNMFPSGAHQAGALAFRAGASALLAAALVGGYRAVKHFNRVSEMAESDNPTKDLTSKVTTTFAGSLTPKKKDDTEKEAKQIKKEAKYDGKYVSTSPLSGATAFDVAIPVGAALLAAAGVYKAVDSWANARRNRLLDAGIAAKDNALKQLMQTRARVAKGMATQKQVEKAINSINDQDIFVKQAKDEDKKGLISTITGGLVSGAGLGISALLLASAIGSYKYFSSRDENNIRFRALKKGLQGYARGKTSVTPVTIVPTDTKEYFAALDRPQQKQKKQLTSVRQEPQLTVDRLNKPISITL